MQQTYKNIQKYSKQNKAIDKLGSVGKDTFLGLIH